MSMIVNSVAIIIALSVFATFVGQVLAPLRRSVLWAAPAPAPLAPGFAATLQGASAEVIALDDRRRSVTTPATQPIAA